MFCFRTLKSFTNCQCQRYIPLKVYRLSIQHNYSTKQRTLKTLHSRNIEKLKKLFHCTNEQATKAYETYPQFELDDVTEKLKWLQAQKFSLPVILDNYGLLQKPLASMEASYKLLVRMGWKKFDDFLPLLILNEDRVEKILYVEPSRIKDRVYAFSKEFSIEPALVSKYFAMYPYIFSVSRDKLSRKLKLLLSYNIQPNAILMDLNILFRSDQALTERLALLSANKVECIIPWMLKCSDSAIQKTFEKTIITAQLDSNFETVKKHDGLKRNDSTLLKIKTIEKLKEMFECSEAAATEAYFTLNRASTHLNEINKNIEWLKSKNATISVILDNCKLTLLTAHFLQTNFALLKSMEWKKTDDFVPLLIMSRKQINKYGIRIRYRIYTLAKEFSMEPHLVSKYCVSHKFMFESNEKGLIERIQLLHQHNVSSENILKDLKSLDNAAESINARLEYLKAHNVGHIKPWMIKCQQISIERLLKNRKKFTDKENQIADIFTSKLKLHASSGRYLVKQYPFLNYLDLNEFNKIIDFLLERFSSEQIKQNMHIFEKSLAELKQRAAKIEAIGKKNSLEFILAKNDMEFEFYLKMLEKTIEIN